MSADAAFGKAWRDRRRAGPPRLRFAPSPNGPLHLGHALSALANERVAAAVGGTVLLRIEDIDTARARPEHAAAIREDLAWLGCEWAELPAQSTRTRRYAEALAGLRERGLVYPCHASRAAVAEAAGEARDPDGGPRFSDRAVSAGGTHEAPAWRLDTRRALDALTTPLSWQEDGAGPEGGTGLVPADAARWGDPVIARRDIATSYHLSAVLDDADQGIGHVVRGRDLFHATALHRLLQETLGLPAPRYTHHRLLLGQDGRKLSKSEGAARLSSLRDVAPARLRRALLDAPLDGPDAPAPDL